MDAKVGFILTSFVMLLAIICVSATPTGPTSLNVVSNETANSSLSGSMVNISGGYLAKIDINATIQNDNWKAFLGNISGSFKLNDASGSTIYDWTTSTTNGEILATRDSGSIEWVNISCANATEITAEEVAMNHTGSDNISSTFTALNNSLTYSIAGQTILNNTCSSVNTYINNASQSSNFEEIILHDETSIIYAATIEEDVAGYDNQTYDFQMLIPENGADSFTGATAYYLYVELN